MNYELCVCSAYIGSIAMFVVLPPGRPLSGRAARPLESRSAVPMSAAANVGHHGGLVGQRGGSVQSVGAQAVGRLADIARPRPWLRVSALCVTACLRVPVPRALA